MGVSFSSVCCTSYEPASRHLALQSYEMTRGLGKQLKTLKGKVHNCVSEKLGWKRCKEICNNHFCMSLENIHYCQTELPGVTLGLKGMRSALRLHEETPGKRLINHDFLVIEIHTNSEIQPKIFLRAEKCCGGDKIGIVIGVHEEYEAEAAKICLFTVKCESKIIGMEDLFEVLADQCPDYSAIEHNCWEYARSTTKRLLKACQRLPRVNKQEEKRLQEEIDSVEARIMGNLVTYNGMLIAASAVVIAVLDWISSRCYVLGAPY